MTPNLTSGTFKVVSLIDGNPPVGVNFTRPAGQPVYLNGPVRTWTVTQEGENTYRLGVGGYSYTGVVGNRVTASIFPEQSVEWIATYGERQDAYIISNRSIVWTVADSNDASSNIVLKPSIVAPSIPPVYITTQLFRFEEVDG